MKHHEDIAKMLEILPRLVGFLQGSFKPEIAKHLKKNEVRTLMWIKNHPNRRMKEYVAMIGIESGSFTYIADKLEAKGFIRRVEGETDKREKVLELTKDGVNVTNKLIRQHEAHIASRITALDESDLQQIKQATDILENIFKKLENSVVNG